MKEWKSSVLRVPLPAELVVKVYDWDRFGFDELIGETLIDLEDRWFCEDWQDLGKNHA